MVDLKHTPIPVKIARKIATKYNKSMVVILAYDPNSERIHTTTFGVNYVDKEWAALIGEKCSKIIGCDMSKKITYEDFRKSF